MRFWGSSIGKKIVMAVTGALMVVFVIGHMSGNLKMFGGVDPQSGLHKIDAYAMFLRSLGEDVLGPYGFLWLTRIGLLASVLLHIVAAVSLTQQNVRARPGGYRVPGYQSSTVASRTMRYGGVFLLFFIVIHILHFTTGHLHFEGFVYGNVFDNVRASFAKWYWVAFYGVAMGALGLHLYHGVWSMVQTLGIDTPRWNASIRCAAKTIAAVVAVGFLSVPLAVFLKLIGPGDASEAVAVSLMQAPQVSAANSNQ
jgi:succinate dehydrogenase / fumarate reductase cytochrome b subunit